MSAVYLLGFRAAGKTTLGRFLAAEEGWQFLDLDEEWEKRHGISILDFVEREGLANFREAEFRLLEEMEKRKFSVPTLLATGGGWVDFGPSRALMAQSPRPKIFLEVDEATLWERLAANPERRKIGGLSSQSALSQLLAARTPHYTKIATHRVKNQDITLGLTETKQLLRGLWGLPGKH